MKNYKTYNSSYSNLHYSYFNSNKLIYHNCNKFKRKRLKDSYVDLANEKTDFISFEINQKELEKINNKTTILKPISHSKSANNSQFFNANKKNSKIEFNLKSVYGKKFEIKKLEKPYSTTLRSQSYIINNKFQNLFDNKNNNKSKKMNQRKINTRNNIQSYKTEKKTKNIFDEKNSALLPSTKISNNISNINIIKDEEIKNNEEISSDYINYNKENNIINDINNINNNQLILKKKNDFDNLKNNSFEYNNKIKRKLNYEENKNNEYNIKNKTSIHNSLKKINEFLENNFHKNKFQKYIPKTNNLKKRLLKKSSSCPSIYRKNKNKENKYKISNKIKIYQNDELKENIKKILKNDRKKLNGNKIFNINKNQKNKYSTFINEDEYNDEKLKHLLSKIPNHNGKNELKKYPDYMIMFKDKNVNLVEKYNSIQNIKNIMPPNNLQDLIYKKELNFFYKLK